MTIGPAPMIMIGSLSVLLAITDQKLGTKKGRVFPRPFAPRGRNAPRERSLDQIRRAGKGEGGIAVDGEGRLLVPRLTRQERPRYFFVLRRNRGDACPRLRHVTDDRRYVSGDSARRTQGRLPPY